MKINKRSLFLLIFFPTLLLFIAILSFLVYQKMESLRRGIEAQLTTQGYLHNLLIDLLNAETGQRGYLLTEKEVFLKPYFLALKDLKLREEEYNEVKGLAVIPESQLVKLVDLTDKKFTLMEQSIDKFNNGAKKEAVGIVYSEKGRVIMDSIRTLIEPNIQLLEKTLIKNQTELSKHQLISVVLIVIVFFLVLLGGALFYAYSKDEVAARDLMTRTLEERNAQLKAFTYQSYHQLKTPLRSISGFLQLLDKKVGKDMDEEAKEMITFSVEACVKMNEQIDEIREKYLS